KVYHCPCPRAHLVRLDNVQSLAAEEECVVAEQFVQLRNHRMVIGNHLGLELAQSLLDLRGVQFHSAHLRFDSQRSRISSGCVGLSLGRRSASGGRSAITRIRHVKTLAGKAKCVSPYVRHERHEQLKVQNGAVGDAEQSARGDEGDEPGDGEPAAAAEVMLPRPLSLNSQPPGNKRAPTSMIFCVAARTCLASTLSSSMCRLFHSRRSAATSGIDRAADILDANSVERSASDRRWSSQFRFTS